MSFERSNDQKLASAPARSWYSPVPMDIVGRALDGVALRERHAIDIGCGTGRGTFQIAEQFPGTRVTGIDINAGVIEAAERDAAQRGTENIRFLVGDVGGWRLPSGMNEQSADLVTGFGLVDNLSALKLMNMAENVDRALLPGGGVILSGHCPSRDSHWLHRYSQSRSALMGLIPGCEIDRFITRPYGLPARDALRLPPAKLRQAVQSGDYERLVYHYEIVQPVVAFAWAGFYALRGVAVDLSIDPADAAPGPENTARSYVLWLQKLRNVPPRTAPADSPAIINLDATAHPASAAYWRAFEAVIRLAETSGRWFYNLPVPTGHPDGLDP